MMNSFLTLLGLALCLGTYQDPEPPKKPAQELKGLWLGTLKAGVVDLRLAFEIEEEKEGKYLAKLISIDQNNTKVPCTKVANEDGKVTLVVAFGMATYQGKFTSKGSLDGTFEQNKKKFPLILERVEKLPTVVRPQMPKGPFPYLVEDVTFANRRDKITLAGTLTMPKGAGPFPAVVLVTGSGPQDRDETLFGHKPFWVIADHLARQGIASLRYDDRGVGKSGGKFATATTADFATDALAAVQFLRTLKRVDSGNIGICGHSEGGIIGPLVARQSPKDVAFLVLLAGTGIPGDKIIRHQMKDFGKLLGESETDLAQGEEFIATLFPLAKQAKSTEEAKKLLQGAIDTFATKIKEEKDRKTFLEASPAIVEQFSSPWLRWFISHDPASTLARVRCPVLAMNGEKDLQVKPGDNLPPIRDALARAGNREVTLKEWPQLNHLFQHCKTGLVSEYGLIEETFSPEVLAFMSDWIKTRK